MSRAHICNTFFERELQAPSQKTVQNWLRSHPIVMQLQFLPLLYAAPEEIILVSDLPDNPDPRLCLLDNLPSNITLEHWGPSLAIHSFAKKNYALPDWELTRKVNSKVFSFTESPKLPGAKLLTTQEEIQSWIESTPGPKILKTPFGTAGSGHITPKIGAISGDPDTNVKRLYTPPLIGEPWVERILDFSSQWQDGKLLGITIFENEPNGTYKGTYVGDVEKWALDEHLNIAHPLIEKITQMGYLGNIGIDAFIYMWKGKKRLHPVVEINARKTMSWVALQLPSKRLQYTHTETGLLPTHLGKTIFSRNVSSV